MSTTTNMSMGKKQYTHWEYWKEANGPFLLWPSVGYWPKRVFANQDEGSSLVFGLWHWRWRLNLIQVKSPGAPYPSEQEWEDFSAWVETTFGRQFNITHMKLLFDQQPEWRELFSRHGIQMHYIRVLLARELAQLFPAPKK